ncbi:MAG: T9SS type A sorting domain-containing protein [candidate division WOR-3 bacterium]
MPFYSPTLNRNKKSKDGGSAAWWDSLIVALKGGNTQEFWARDMRGDSWIELDTIPSYGTTGKIKRVNAGGDIAAFGDGVFYALKGNKCRELWRYVARTGIVAPAPPMRSGVMAEPSGRSKEEVAFATNPVRTGSVGIRYVLMKPGLLRVRLFDATGSLVMQQCFAAGRSGTAVLDLSSLARGVYLARIETEKLKLVKKLVVER